MSGPILTHKRRLILQRAAKHPLGQVTNPYHRGFERNNWNRSAEALVTMGLLQPYVHGGFEITLDGRSKAEGWS